MVAKKNPIWFEGAVSADHMKVTTTWAESGVPSQFSWGIDNPVGRSIATVCF
jgi:hypothetical protein